MRHELDLSQKRLGLTLGVSEVTIRRWEKNKDKPISPTSDRFLRVVYSSWTDGRDSTRELIDMLAEMDQEEAKNFKQVHFKEEKRRWEIDYNCHEAQC